MSLEPDADTAGLDLMGLLDSWGLLESDLIEPEINIYKKKSDSILDVTKGTVT